jgi:hypothetical protein
MDTLIFAANSVLPIILVIFLGYKLKNIGFLNDNFLKIANKLVFNVCLPAYLFYNVYTIDSFSTVNWGIVLYCVIFILVLYFISLACTLVYTKDNGKRGALIQCSFRSNFAIIGLTLAKSIGGNDAVAIAAVLSAFSIPLFNILAVITLSIFGNSSDGKPTVKSILLSIAKNPLIRGVLSALVCLVIRKLEPLNSSDQPIFTIADNLPFLYKAIESVSSIASPLALIVLGGQFTFSAVRSLAGDIVYGTLWRLVITPFTAIALIALLSNSGILHADTTCYPSLVALFGSPVAVSSAIMAEAMDCHGELARQLVVWTSLVSIITIFAAIVLLRSFGLI